MYKTEIRVPVEPDTADFTRPHECCNFWELSDVRAKCEKLYMEPCYRRYRERLVLTNLAIYLFIMEVTMIIHLTWLLCISELGLLDTVPFISIMAGLPLILYICFRNKNEFNKFPLWNNLASAGAIILVTFMDSYVTVKIRSSNGIPYCVFDHISIISIYIFLPITYYGKPIFLSAIMCIWYFIFIWIQTAINRRTFAILSIYAIYLISLNVLMMTIRYSIEYRLRNKILTRRQQLHQNILLKLAMRKEAEMINTILPSEIAASLQQEIRSRIEDARLGKNYLALRTVFVEIHSDVSILVADMVNFTYLSTQLECKQLVIILHELFVAYDLAAERLKILRIKFSGDCYNCAAGMPQFYPEHAKACVEFAMHMIEITKKLGRKWMLNLGIRVGVHSGEVFSGIIGTTKWQYDIWSKDVDIAYRLENTGMAGMIHISKSTLSMLENTYPYKEGNHLTTHDALLQRLQIKTYLIAPIQIDNQESNTSLESNTSRQSMFSRISIVQDIFSPEIDEIQHNTRYGMIEKAEQMPVGCIQFARIFNFAKRHIPGDEDSKFRPQISSIWRLFRTGDNEWIYMNEPDVQMKYSLLMVFYVGVYILACDQISEFPSDGPTIYLLLLIMFLVCLVAFYKHIWLELTNLPPMSEPTQFISRWIFVLSKMFEKQLLARILVTFSSIFIVYCMATLNTVQCDLDKFHLSLIEAGLMSNDRPHICFDPWQITQYVILVLSLLFFFSGLSLVFKAGLAILITASYILVANTFEFAWARSNRIKEGLSSELSGIWYVLEFCFLLLISEQHFAYIDKADYYSKLCYEEKLKRTEISTQSVNIMLNNILPRHVADSFMEKGHSNELFSETYSKIAVMFATIENYQAESIGLRVLNEFICCFDDLLVNYMGQFKVEKIKVIDWTYMAACGLQADCIDDPSMQLPERNHKKKRKPLFKRSAVRFLNTKIGRPLRAPSFVPRFKHPNLQKDDECVFTMLKFAVEMILTLENISKQILDFGSSMEGNLKIGISHGPVMAGVVGFSRPQYDIWGHTVNMASRMSTTGITGSIHVTENTATVLQYFDVKCNYRGMTHVKGVGPIPTYLLALDESFHLQHIDDVDFDTTINFVDEQPKLGPKTSKAMVDEKNLTEESKTWDSMHSNLNEEESQTERKKRSTMNGTQTKQEEDSNTKGTQTTPKNFENEKKP